MSTTTLVEHTLFDCVYYTSRCVYDRLFDSLFHVFENLIRIVSIELKTRDTV